VDLWGGQRDRGLPWRQDILVLVFSVTKGMTATALAVAHVGGLLDYDTPVAAYWPELAQAGKEAITVGRCRPTRPGSPPSTSACGWPAWPIRTGAPRSSPASGPSGRPGYHALTSGWIAAELIARTDPAGRTLGRFFAEEVAAPLGLDFHIGLPPDVPDERVARIKAFHGMRLLLHPRTMPPGMLLAFAAPRSFTSRTFFNPRLASPWDVRPPRAAPHPDPGRQRDRHRARRRPLLRSWPPVPGPWGLTDRTLNEVTAAGVPPADGWGDLVWHTDMRYSAGFLKPSPACPSGPATARSAPTAPAAPSASPTPTWAWDTPTHPIGWLPPVRRSPRAGPPHRRLPLPWYPAAQAPPQPLTVVPRHLSGAPTVSTTLSGLSSLLPAGERHRVPTGDGGQLHAVTAGRACRWC
jgi:CubicO group peptidase (beta-lactamase class C family)